MNVKFNLVLFKIVLLPYLIYVISLHFTCFTKYHKKFSMNIFIIITHDKSSQKKDTKKEKIKTNTKIQITKKQTKSKKEINKGIKSIVGEQSMNE